MTGWVMERGVEAYLVGIAARGLALLVLTSVAVLLLRRRSAAARYWVWFMGLMGLLLLPVAGLLGPRWTLDLPVATLGPGPGAAAVPFDAALLPSGPRMASPGGRAATTGKRSSATRPDRVDPPSEAAVEPSASGPLAAPRDMRHGSPGLRAGTAARGRPEGGARLPLPATLLALWAVGVAGLLLRLLANHLALFRVQAQAHVHPEGAVVARARELSKRVGVRRPVRILRGPSDAMPMSWGSVRPSILLPGGADAWPAERVDAVLLHELAHVRRRDCLAQLAAEVAVAIHWCNPLAWLAAHRLRVEREHACDDEVLRHGTRPSRYASELVALARAMRPGTLGASAAVAILGPADLKARVRAVLDAGRPRSLSGTVANAGIGVAAATVLALATVTPAQARPEGPDPAPTSSAETPAPPPPTASAPVDAEVPAPASMLQVTTCGLANDGWQRSSHQSTDDDSHKLEWSRPGCSVEVRVEGDVDFTDDFRGVARLARDAYLRVEENDGSTQRWLEVRAGSQGRPTFEYRVNGRDQAFDEEARAWYAAMLLQVVRRSGFRAEERVAALLRSGGVPAVLAELELLTADHVFAVYTEHLIRQADISEEQAVRLVDRARTRIDSDHYMAEILMALADRHLTSQRGVDVFLEAARTLESDHYRAQVLGHALEHRTISPAQVAALIDAVPGMESDHYVAEVLKSVAAKYFLDEDMRATYLRAVRGVESDHYRSEILGALLDRNDLSGGELSDVLAAIGEMESEHYQTELLKRFASEEFSGGDMDRYLTVVAGMDSDHYQSEALRYLSLMDLSDADLARVIRGVALMDSDHYKATLLVELAAQDRVRQGALYDAMIEAMNTIDSKHSRGEVAESLLRR